MNRSVYCSCSYSIKTKNITIHNRDSCFKQLKHISIFYDHLLGDLCHQRLRHHQPASISLTPSSRSFRYRSQSRHQILQATPWIRKASTIKLFPPNKIWVLNQKQGDLTPKMDVCIIEIYCGVWKHPLIYIYMDVSKNRGTWKWMVKIMENPMNKWMICLGGFPPIFGNIHSERQNLCIPQV